MKVYEVGDLLSSDDTPVIGVLIEGTREEVQQAARLLGREVRIEAVPAESPMLNPGKEFGAGGIPWAGGAP